MGTLTRHARRAHIAGLVVALGLAVAACGGEDESPAPAPGGGEEGGTTAIKVATLPITSNAVIQLAQDKGWFGEEGLTVETITVPNPAAVVAAVQGGQAQFGYSPSIPVLSAAGQGVDLKVVAPADGTNPEARSAIEGGASPGEYDDTAVLARPDAGISSPKDLAGKTVAVPARKAQMEVTIAKAVADDGGDPAKIKWIALGFPEMGAALEAKRVDAIGTVTPFTGQAEAKGAKPVAYPALALFPEGAVGLWISSGEYVDGNPEVVQAFQRVIEKANAYANDNLDEVLQIATTTTQTPIDVLKDAAEPYWPTAVTAKDLQRAADAMVELGYLPSAPDVKAILAT
jgi:ABC-type nitrate/sulfonate/bicarbonate transport system substrate-binding protein